MIMMRLFQEILSTSIDDLGGYDWIEVGRACYDKCEDIFFLRIIEELAHRRLVIRATKPMVPPIAGAMTHMILSLSQNEYMKCVGQAWGNYKELDLNLELYEKPSGLLLVSRTRDLCFYSKLKTAVLEAQTLLG